MSNPTYRKHKYLNLGFFWLRYIHYYPQVTALSHFGWMTTNFKDFSIDFYWAKHVFVFSFIKGR